MNLPKCTCTGPARDAHDKRCPVRIVNPRSDLGDKTKFDPKVLPPGAMQGMMSSMLGMLFSQVLTDAVKDKEGFSIQIGTNGDETDPDFESADDLAYDEGLHDGLQEHRALTVRWLRSLPLSDVEEQWPEALADQIEAGAPEKWDSLPKKE